MYAWLNEDFCMLSEAYIMVENVLQRMVLKTMNDDHLFKNNGSAFSEKVKGIKITSCNSEKKASRL